MPCDAVEQGSNVVEEIAKAAIIKINDPQISALKKDIVKLKSPWIKPKRLWSGD